MRAGLGLSVTGTVHEPSVLSALVRAGSEKKKNLKHSVRIIPSCAFLVQKQQTEIASEIKTRDFVIFTALVCARNR